jgi:hypothetical protein
VTIERNKLIKVYCYANLVFFILQMIVLGLTIGHILDKVSILTDSRTEPSPLYVNNTYFCSGWACCFAFQALFVMRAFYCRRISTHYRNCLTLKIRLNFVITCSLFIYILVLVSVTTISKSLWEYAAIAFIFLLLKRKYFRYFIRLVNVHYLLYSRVKYRDDGREKVSFMEFVTIHVTFPLMSAWFSY